MSTHGVWGRAPVAEHVRASGALSAFTNALTVSLLALLPGNSLGWAAVVMAAAGLLFTAGSARSMLRIRHRERPGRTTTGFLLALVLVYGFQLNAGIRLMAGRKDTGLVDTIALLMVACMLIGIGRAWEIVGLRRPGPTASLGTLLRNVDLERARTEAPASRDDES